MVWLPLKCTWVPYLPHTCLMLSEMPLVYGMTIWPIVVLLLCKLMVGLLSWFLMLVLPLLFWLVLLLLVELLLLLLLCKTFCCTLFMAQAG